MKACFLSAGGFIMALVLLSVLPWPEKMIQEVGLHSTWMLEDYDSTAHGSRLERIAKKWIATTWQSNLLWRWVQIHLKDKRQDQDWNIQALQNLRPLYLNQFELHHTPSTWVASAAGIGFCDQINAVAAQVFRFRYPKSQTYNLFYKSERGGHSIFRFYSPLEQDWIYGDLWNTEPVLFKQSETKIQLEHLWKFSDTKISVFPASLKNLLQEAYSLTAEGNILQDYQSNSFFHFQHRLIQRFQKTKDLGLASYAPPSEPNPSKPWALKENKKMKIDLNPSEEKAVQIFFKIYMKARLHHFIGSSKQASEAYLESLRSLEEVRWEALSPSLQGLKLAAEIFKSRLQKENEEINGREEKKAWNGRP